MVVVTQALGGSYTVASREGLSRITEGNADALGLERRDDGTFIRKQEPVTPELLADAPVAKSSCGRS